MSTHAQKFPPPQLVHGCLVAAQIFFGVGSVVGALGLPAMNPLAFALYREVSAGIILLLSALALQHFSVNLLMLPLQNNLRRFLLLGLVIFGNQAGVIAGIKLAGPVAASIWQPSQPVMTAAICMFFRWETPRLKRILGVIFAFLGCATMVVLSAKDGAGSEGGGGGGGAGQAMAVLAGNVLFFLNCLCTSLYVILSKSMLRLYPSLTVTAWSYTIAAVFMLITTLTTSVSGTIMAFLCPDCIDGPWHFPSGAILAMVYFVLFVSVISYAMITWANQYVTGTLVMGYSVLQPVSSALLTVTLLAIGAYQSCVTNGASATTGDDDEDGNDVPEACLDYPGWGSLFGTAGVFLGLSLVISTEPQKKEGDDGIGPADNSGKYEEVSHDDSLHRGSMVTEGVAESDNAVLQLT